MENFQSFFKIIRFVTDAFIGCIIPSVIGYRLSNWFIIHKINNLIDPSFLKGSFITILIAIFYFTITKRKWWYGILSSIIGIIFVQIEHEIVDVILLGFYWWSTGEGPGL